MPSNFIDLTGKVFGEITVLYRVTSPKKGIVCWMCRCSCGKEWVVDGHSLKKGNTRSCGCMHKKQTSEIFYKHGCKPRRLYSIWITMKNRCYNKRTTKYADYGARGITICNEWRHNFAAFRDWALAHGYANNLTIDRIDVNGNYCPENCRWATAIEQASNRRNSILITYNGETHTAAEWSRITGIYWGTIYTRIHKGWPPEKILAPVSK